MRDGVHDLLTAGVVREDALPQRNSFGCCHRTRFLSVCSALIIPDSGGICNLPLAESHSGGFYRRNDVSARILLTVELRFRAVERAIPSGPGARAGDFLRRRLAKLSQYTRYTPRGGFFGVTAPSAEARRKPPLKGEVSALADGGVGQHTPLKRLLKGYCSQMFIE